MNGAPVLSAAERATVLGDPPRCSGDLLVRVAALSAENAKLREPVPMLLFCPSCYLQHIDAPEPDSGWTNPPHKSHLCRGCKTVWRPSDVPTMGVLALATRGKADTWP